jgi:hypothetical protein
VRARNCNLSISICAEMAGSVLECSADGATFTAAARVNQAYPDGQHTFALRGRDAAGNLSPPKTVTSTTDPTVLRRALRGR